MRVIAIALAVAATVLGVPSNAASADPPAARAAAGDAAQALAQAKRDGKRVKIASQTTSTAEVFANPSGTFTMEQAVLPVRVRQGGAWTPVDTTLVAGSGRVAPKATTVPVTFSGGGSGPAVTIGAPGKRLELTWPAPLPTPAIDGDTAVYAEVLPGVDLRLTATSTGYSKVILVKSRQAAANPTVSRLKFAVKTAGLTLRGGKEGTLEAVDAAGTVAYASEPLQQWDSGTAAKTGKADSARVEKGLRESSRQGGGKLELAGGAVSAVPDRAFLDDPATVYPVAIDPNFSAPKTGWAKVFQGKPTNSYWNGGVDGAEAKVGECYVAGGDCNGIGTARTYFQFDSGALLGKRIISAEFNIRNFWASTCSARSIEMWQTNPIDTGLTWNSQPSAIGISARDMAYGHSCPTPPPANTGPNPAWVGFNATTLVQNRVMGDNSNVVTLMLRGAGDENDQLGWRKFDSGGTYNPTLLVEYNSYPNKPTSPGFNPNVAQSNAILGCGDYSFSSTPTLSANLTDPDNDSLHAHFEWFVAGGGPLVGWTVTNYQPSGTGFAAQIPAGQVADGVSIGWHVRGGDNYDWGPWSDWCVFTVDKSAPSAAPTITSTDYPASGQHGNAGVTGSFTFDRNGVGDVAGFVYRLNNSPATVVDKDNRYGADPVANSVYVPVNGSGQATVRITPPEALGNKLYAFSVDHAGNISPIQDYGFQVGNNLPAPVGYWDLDGNDIDTTAVDGSGHGHDGSVPAQPTAAWTVGRVDNAVRFNGTSGFIGTANGQTVDTTGTYTVSAWARIDNADNGWHTVVSQDGNRASAFYLQYLGDTHQWSLTVSGADTDWQPVARAVSDSPAQAGVWTHLTAQYDVGSHQAKLFVNGVQQAGVVTVSTPIPSGSLQIGRGKFNGDNVDFFPGAIDEVKVYNRLLTAPEIHDHAVVPASEELFYGFDDGGGPVARDLSGNVRNGAVNGAVTWEPAGALGDSAAHFTGQTDVSVPAAIRTDRSYTVEAYARLDAGGSGARTVASQEGSVSSAFFLQYRPWENAWAFIVTAADANNPNVAIATIPAGNITEWTHLTGVYDQAAGTATLYVNGDKAHKVTVPATTSWHAGGPTRVGSAKWNSVRTDWVNGVVDQVHIYSGVRTPDQVEADFVAPVVTPTSVYSGQFGRFVSPDGERAISVNGAIRRGFRFETPLGLPAPAGAPDTKMLYSCLYGADEFVSGDPNCEGQQRLGELGLVYNNQPQGVNVVPMYRCNNGPDHSVSLQPDCEGWPVEGFLGWSRAYAFTYRYASVRAPWDHLSTIAAAPAGYRPESVLGLMPVYDTGVTSIQRCKQGNDEYTDLAADCGGNQVVAPLGNIWVAPPVDFPSLALYRCQVASTPTPEFPFPTGERFDSTDEYCDGHGQGAPLGYFATGL